MTLPNPGLPNEEGAHPRLKEDATSPRAQFDSITSWAIHYGKVRGWKLFPAWVDTKRPMFKTGRDHAEHSSNNESIIRSWFEGRYQGAALGVVTGACSNLIVLDADAKHQGEAKLAELEHKLGPLPRDYVVRTQNGGIHLYFRHPQGGYRVKSGAGDKSPLGAFVGHGVDVRADGGIVIAPPSAGYVWEHESGRPGPQLPDAWLAALRPSKVRAEVRVVAPSPAYSGPTSVTGRAM